MVQKRPGPCGNVDFVARGLNRQLIQCLRWRLRLARAGSKTGEIVSAHKNRRGVRHCDGVQSRWHPPGQARIHRQGGAPVHNTIAVGTLDGGEPGMEVGRRDRRAQNAGGCLFQVRVQGVANRCLLYTSPSPRGLSTSRMPSSA